MGIGAQISKMGRIREVGPDGIGPSQRDRLIVQNVAGWKAGPVPGDGIGCPWRGILIVRIIEGVTSEYLIGLVECMVRAYIEGPRVGRKRCGIDIVRSAGENIYIA